MKFSRPKFDRRSWSLSDFYFACSLVGPGLLDSTGFHQAFIRHSSGIHQAFFRHSSGTHLKTILLTPISTSNFTSQMTLHLTTHFTIQFNTTIDNTSDITTSQSLHIKSRFHPRQKVFWAPSRSTRFTQARFNIRQQCLPFIIIIFPFLFISPISS